MAQAALIGISLLATGFQFVESRKAASAAKTAAKAQADQDRLRLQGDLIDQKRRFIEQTQANIAASAASGIDPFQGSSAAVTEEGFRRFDLQTLSTEVSGQNRQREILAAGDESARRFKAEGTASLLNTASQFANRG